MGIKLRIALFLLLLPISMGTQSALAKLADRQWLYAAGQVGVFAPLDYQQSIQIPLGLGVGFRPKTSYNWLFGGFFSYSSQGLNVLTSNVTASNFFFGLDGQYLLTTAQNMTGFFIGAKTGLYYRTLAASNNALGLPVTESSATLNLILGPKIGYEYTTEIGLGFGIESYILFCLSNNAIPFGLVGTLRLWL